MELTPLFWQGSLGALGTLLVAGLVFVILSFSQLAQSLTELKTVASAANSFQTFSLCQWGNKLEWSLAWDGSGYETFSHKYRDVIAYLDEKQLLLHDPSVLSEYNFCDNFISSDDCEQRSTTFTWLVLSRVSDILRNRPGALEVQCRSSAADGEPVEKGLIIDALCEAYPSSPSWPCFGNTECYSTVQSEKELQLAREKEITLSLTGKLPPPCVWHMKGLAGMFIYARPPDVRVL